MLKNKGRVYIPQSAFHCSKRCLRGPGGSEPRQSCAHLHMHPRFLPRLCLAPRVQLEEPDNFSLQMLHPSAGQPPAAADPPCPCELSSHGKHGVHRGGDDFPAGATPKKTSAQRRCRGIATLPRSFCQGSALSGCSLLLPKGKENFCDDHEYFFLLGQLLHLFSQGLRQRSDSKVHGAHERRGPGLLWGKGTGGRTSKSSARLSPPDFLPKKILAEKPGIICK